MKKRAPQTDLFKDLQQRYLTEARTVAMEIAATEGRVSADEVRERCPIPGGISKNVMGKLFKTPAFVWLSVKKSSTPTRKGGFISVYGLSDTGLLSIQRQLIRKAEVCQR